MGNWPGSATAGAHGEVRVVANFSRAQWMRRCAMKNEGGTVGGGLGVVWEGGWRLQVCRCSCSCSCGFGDTNQALTLSIIWRTSAVSRH